MGAAAETAKHSTQALNRAGGRGGVSPLDQAAPSPLQGSSLHSLCGLTQRDSPSNASRAWPRKEP